MPRYRYAGPAPVPDPEGEAVHPGDVREYDEEPGWGPWELLGEPDAGPRRIGDDVPVGGAPDPASSLTVPPVTPKGK